MCAREMSPEIVFLWQNADSWLVCLCCSVLCANENSCLRLVGTSGGLGERTQHAKEWGETRWELKKWELQVYICMYTERTKVLGLHNFAFFFVCFFWGDQIFPPVFSEQLCLHPILHVKSMRGQHESHRTTSATFQDPFMQCPSRYTEVRG